DDEKVELVRQVREAIPDKNVVAGTGSYDTHHSGRLSARAIAARAGAPPGVVAHYHHPPPEGLYQHLPEIAKAGPVIMYNIQARTGVNMTAATTLRCAELPDVIGVKEASGDIDQMGFVCSGSPPGFKVWSGDDSFTLPLLAVGGYGVICVVSHIAGSSMKAMLEAHLAGRNEEGRRIHL